MNLKNKKILVTGGSGFLGSCVVAELVKDGLGPKNIIVPRSGACDLREWKNCQKVCKGIDVVIHLAAKVGGIGFNLEKPGELFYDNLIMGVQLMEAARQAEVSKFVSAGTICSYPKFTPVPFKEKDLWGGYPEETNAPYGLAKKMLLVQSQAYRSQYKFNAIHLLMVNLYGPRDNFNLFSSHVIPALIRKVSEAKKRGKKFIEVWGTGKVTREFLYVEDAARGIILALKKYNKSEPVNLGAGKEISIKDLVNLICKIMEFKGEIIWNTSMPDGQPRRMLDITLAKKEFGFGSRIDFKDGLKKTIDWYLDRSG